MKKKIDTESLWKEISALRWQLLAFPNENYTKRSKRIFKLLDQLIDLHKREIHPEHYNLSYLLKTK